MIDRISNMEAMLVAFVAEKSAYCSEKDYITKFFILQSSYLTSITEN